MQLIKPTTFSFHPALKLVWAAGAVLLIAVSITPQDQLPQVGDFNDKLAHFFAYLLVGLPGVFTASSTKRKLVLVGMMGLLGLALEAAQLYVPGRHFEMWDGVANALGAMAAYGVFGIYNRLRG